MLIHHFLLILFLQEENVEETSEDILTHLKTLSADKIASNSSDGNILKIDSTDETIKKLISKQQEQISAAAVKKSENKLIDSEMKKLVLNQYNNRAASDSEEE